MDGGCANNRAMLPFVVRMQGVADLLAKCFG